MNRFNSLSYYLNNVTNKANLTIIHESGTSILALHDPTTDEDTFIKKESKPVLDSHNFVVQFTGQNARMVFKGDSDDSLLEYQFLPSWKIYSTKWYKVERNEEFQGYPLSNEGIVMRGQHYLAQYSLNDVFDNIHFVKVDPSKEASVTISGSLMYLWNYKDPVNTGLHQYAFKGLFSNNTDVETITVKPNVLGLVTSTAPYCFAQLFKNSNIDFTGTSSLTAELTEGCYSEMFSTCTKLVTPPLNLATYKDFPDHSCEEIFSGCVNLNTNQLFDNSSKILYVYNCGMLAFCRAFAGVNFNNASIKPSIEIYNTSTASFMSAFEGSNISSLIININADAIKECAFESAFANAIVDWSRISLLSDGLEASFIGKRAFASAFNSCQIQSVKNAPLYITSTTIQDEAFYGTFEGITYTEASSTSKRNLIITSSYIGSNAFNKSFAGLPFKNIFIDGYPHVAYRGFYNAFNTSLLTTVEVKCKFTEEQVFTSAFANAKLLTDIDYKVDDQAEATINVFSNCTAVENIKLYKHSWVNNFLSGSSPTKTYYDKITVENSIDNASGTYLLNPNEVYYFTVKSDIKIETYYANASKGEAEEYHFFLEIYGTPTVTWPSRIWWHNDTLPEIEDGMVIEVSIQNNVAAFLKA